jgi:hypothetical protein
MRKIGDYIHLYLGCECVLVDEDSVERKILLTRYNLNYYKDYLDDIKLLLRPLSTMTKDECIVLTGYDKFKDQREIIDFGKDNQLAWINYRWKDNTIGNAEGYAYSSNGIYFDKEEWSPELFVYLLRQRFDIFNLIKEGLALESKTK